MTETKFHVKPLPHARIPIIKLNLDPSPGLPFGIACDIGFENRLALENTRLLFSYATVDPTRVRTMVLFCESTPARNGSDLTLLVIRSKSVV
jgi:terminal uridylyltransferase